MVAPATTVDFALGDLVWFRSYERNFIGRVMGITIDGAEILRDGYPTPEDHRREAILSVVRPIDPIDDSPAQAGSIKPEDVVVGGWYVVSTPDEAFASVEVAQVAVLREEGEIMLNRIGREYGLAKVSKLIRRIEPPCGEEAK